ncbi:MAG: methyltransferase domain-containing protein [Gemmatimonadales bacterium]|nr:MAG: methyltransferase domain-containing protein [Gemmatimonadales bacterium]
MGPDPRSSLAAPMTSPDPVARYYDGNTGRFLRFGRVRGSAAIHRALWAPGVVDARGAGNWINRWLAESLALHGSPRPRTLLDLGCGVGGTLLHMAEHLPGAELHGVTISPRQVEMGRELVRSRGAEDRVRIHQGDFNALELGLRFEAAVAVESFVHAETPARFLQTARDHLAPGGLLVVVDDFLARSEDELSPGDQRRIRDFRRGWRLPSLCTVARLEAEAIGLGLEPLSGFDFTHWTRPGRPRDRVIALVAPVSRALGLADVPFFGNMIGGNALQQGMRRGVLRYRGLVLRRSEDGPSRHVPGAPAH